MVEGSRKDTLLLVVLSLWCQTVYSQFHSVGDLRLVGGSKPSEGRVEVFYSGEWGTVCDDSFDDSDAAVVCRQLGFSSAITTTFAFGQGTGNIWLDEVDCYGHESRLDQCTHAGWGQENCGHNEDIGVKCSDSLATVPTYSNGDVRLQDGSVPSEGRVELYYNGQWGTVCDDNWDLENAKVVCRQLGYSTASRETTNSYFGAGYISIVLDDVSCVGNEADLLECYHSTVWVHDCGDTEIAGVVCTPSHSVNTVRLVDGFAANEGRVEVLYNDAWATVCRDHFGSGEASVICRQLGYSEYNQIYSSSQFGSGDLFQRILASIDCQGYEDRWSDCSVASSISLCNHFDDVGLSCQGEYTGVISAATGSLRLVGGNRVSEGRVEIYLNGEWGTICDDSWDGDDAEVVCRQLGYHGALYSVTSAGGGAETQAIALDDVHCTGDEKLLIDCSSSTFHNCEHSEDAGVRCIVTEDLLYTPRLANGTTWNEGRVEIWTGDEWEVLCSNNNKFNVDEIKVLCKELGHKDSYKRYYSNRFGLGVNKIWDYYFFCTGYEEQLKDCGRSTILNPYTYQNCETVAISCDEASLSTGAVIGILVVIIFILVCACGACCWAVKPKQRNANSQPAPAATPMMPTPAAHAPTPPTQMVHPPPAPTHQMDVLPSYTDVVADPSMYPPVGHPQTAVPPQPYAPQPYPQQTPYPPQPTPYPNPQAAYPPQPVTYNPPATDTQPQQTPVVPYPQQQSVAPYPQTQPEAPYPQQAAPYPQPYNPAPGAALPTAPPLHDNNVTL